ncbi:heavy metal translocating P-type ATPase [Spirochaetota bacterium]
MNNCDCEILPEEPELKSIEKYKSDIISKFKKFLFPGFLLILIAASALDVYVFKFLKEDYIGMLAMFIGGGFITWNTLLIVLNERRITAGVLVVLALIGSAYVGEYLAGAIVAFMMIIGEFLEDLTLDKTRNAVRELVKLVPDTARIKEGDKISIVPLTKIKTGNIVIIQPGERIPADGEIIKGHAAVNESSLTGESMPVDKNEGHKVYVGTLNENGVLEVEVKKLGNDTVLGKIISVVQQAQDNKGQTQRIADKFAAYFTPVIIGICVIVWFATGNLTLDERLLRVMTVLVIACPCALVLATPTAVVATVGSAARHGALIKGGVVLENLAKVTTICYDKTGTITAGKPKVVNIKTFGELNKIEVIFNAAIAEKHSGHPLAHAILERAAELDHSEIPESKDFKMNFGKGVQVTYNNETIEIANAKFFNELEGATSTEVKSYIEEQEEMGRTSLLVIKGGSIIGGISIADTVRPEAKKIVDNLRAMGIKRQIMLTGDNAVTGRAIANQVGIDEVKSELLPEEKLRFIENLKEQGENVIMIGDGVNDAPALMLADVGISMGIIGTDVAVESSDISLMSDDLMLVPQLLKAGKRTLFIVKQNIIVFAVFVNVVGIFLSSIGILTPILAALVHNMSSVFVVGNSARLLKYKYNA